MSSLVAYCCSCPPDDARFGERLRALQFNEHVRSVVQDCFTQEIRAQGPLATQDLGRSYARSEGVRQCATRSVHLDARHQETIQRLVMDLAREPPDPAWQACNRMANERGTCPRAERELEQEQRDRQVRMAQEEEERRQNAAMWGAILKGVNNAQASSGSSPAGSASRSAQYTNTSSARPPHVHYCCDQYGDRHCRVPTEWDVGHGCQCPQHDWGVVCH